MELLLLVFAGCFYLFAGYSAALFGFVLALLSLARERVGFWLYWGSLLLAHSLMIANFGWAQWAPYLAGQIAGRLYLPSYADGAERTGARSSRWFRRLRFWRLLHWWTDFRGLPIAPVGWGETPAMYAVHPHGFLPVSAALGFALPGRGGPIAGHVNGRDPLIAVTSLVFWPPLIRELFLWAGCVAAEKRVMLEALESRSLIVAPGGVLEGTVHDHDRVRVRFRHWGFVEVAFRAKAPIVPVFAQGENRVWMTFPGWQRFRRRLGSITGYPFPMIFVPFLFPHELRLREGLALTFLGSDGHDFAWAKRTFEERMRALIEEHEHPDDIDLSQV